MTLNELGAMLLEARTRHNLSVQEMADRLKLPVSTILAIEDGNLKELPHPAYARGFIKAYASMVGIPADVVHEALAVLLEEETPPAPLVTRSSRMAAFSTPRVDVATVFRLIGLLAVLAAAAAIFWFREPIVTQVLELWHSVTAQQETSQPPAALSETSASLEASNSHRAALSEAAQPAAETDTQDAVTAAADTSESAAFVETTGAQVETSAGSADAEQTKTPDTAESGAYAEQNAQQQDLAGSSGNHKLVINAVDTCWVMVRPDSAKPTEFSLRKGEGATFTFNKSLTLRLGNAGGVRLTYDGKAMASPGARGQAKTLTFPPNP